MASNVNASSLQWSNYVDLATDVKPWLQVPSSDTTQDLQLQLIVDMACQWVQSFIGRPVAPTQFDRRYNGWTGWTGAYIELPFYPVIEIVSVTEWWGSSGPHTLSEQTPTNQVDGWTCDYPTGLLTRVFPGLVQKPWFPGARNVEVVWVAGYNPVPADLKVATLELINHWFRNTRQVSAFRAPGVGEGYEYDPEETASGLWQGVPYRIVELLDPYISVAIA